MPRSGLIYKAQFRLPKFHEGNENGGVQARARANDRASSRMFCMRAHICIALLILLFGSGCYRRTSLDPKYTKIESAFERSSIRAISPPMYLSVELSDSRKDIGELMPDVSTISLTSSDGVHYPIRFDAKNFHYTTKEERIGWGRKNFLASYRFEILSPLEPGRQLDNLPTGIYTFSAEFVDADSRNKFTAHIKRRTKLETIQWWDH